MHSASVNLGSPDKSNIAYLLGAAHLNDFLYAFVQGANGDVWCIFFWNNSWSSWVNLGSPPSSGGLKNANGACGVLSGPAGIYVFVCGNDGNVWLDFWNGQTWEWLNLGNPVPGTSETTLLGCSSDGIFGVYVKGGDGNVWCDVWSRVWAWTSQGQAAPAVTVPAYEFKWSSTSWVPFTSPDTCYINVGFGTANGQVACAVTDVDPDSTPLWEQALLTALQATASEAPWTQV